MYAWSPIRDIGTSRGGLGCRRSFSGTISRLNKRSTWSANTEGEVVIVTQIRPGEAARVDAYPYATLLSIETILSVAGVINREATSLPFRDVRARRALNHAINRDRLVGETLFGYADPLGGLIPASAVTFLHRISPYAHDADKAAALWRDAGGLSGHLIRIAAPDELESVALRIAADFREALGVDTRVKVLRGSEINSHRRQLAAKEGLNDWDIFVYHQERRRRMRRRSNSTAHSSARQASSGPVPRYPSLRSFGLTCIVTLLLSCWLGLLM